DRADGSLQPTDPRWLGAVGARALSDLVGAPSSEPTADAPHDALVREPSSRRRPLRGGVLPLERVRGSRAGNRAGDLGRLGPAWAAGVGPTGKAAPVAARVRHARRNRRLQ